MKIKVCGMRENQNIQELVALNPDYIGFIFYPKSSRYVVEKLDKNVLKEIPSSGCMRMTSTLGVNRSTGVLRNSMSGADLN